MYLVSLYFDEKTNKKIKNYIKEIALKSGNTFMLAHDVPPHITILAFETLQIEVITQNLDKTIVQLEQGKLQWVSIGAFPSVLFLQPVLNSYLHNLSARMYESISRVLDTTISKCYRPFQWLPHATIAKQLSEEEMFLAFQTLHPLFRMFEGKVVRVELAKKSPFCVIKSWEL